jgi:nucleoside-diphosphate-sugar epimerase
MNAIKSGKDIIIHGDGMQCRAFCDIRDLLNFLDVINDNEFTGQIYNVGNCENIISIKDLAQLCKKVLGSDVGIKHLNYNECFSSGHQDIMQRRPDCSKMHKLYSTQYSLIDIIKNML